MQSFIESATQNLDPFKEEDITFSNLSLKLATAFGVNFGLSNRQSVSDSINGLDNQDKVINQHIYSQLNLRWIWQALS